MEEAAVLEVDDPGVSIKSYCSSQEAYQSTILAYRWRLLTVASLQQCLSPQVWLKLLHCAEPPTADTLVLWVDGA